MHPKATGPILAIFIVIAAIANAQQWQQMGYVESNDTLRATTIEAILVADPVTYLAATDVGIFRSTDAGVHWSAPYGGWAYAFYKHPDGRIFGGTVDGLSVSTDLGLTWNTVTSHPSIQVCCIRRDSQGRMFTAAWGSASSPARGVLRSTDDGATWTTVIDTSWGETVEVYSGDTVYAGGYTWLRRSTDGGLTWQLLYGGAGVRSVIQAQDGSILFGWYQFDAGWNLNEATFRSTDHGMTWDSVASFYSEYFSTDANGFIYAASDSGMRKSTDNGATWQVLNTGLLNRNGQIPWVRTLSRVGNNEFLAGDYSTGELFRSTDLGAHWATVSAVEYPSPTSPKLSALANKNSTLFIGSQINGMERWTDGVGFQAINTGLGNLVVNSVYVEPGGSIFAATGGGVYRSTDDGAGWTRFGAPTVVVKAVGVLATGEVIAGVANGIIKFPADGSSFKLMSKGLVNKFVNTIWTESGGRAFVGTNDGLYQLNDTVWVPVAISSSAQKVIDMKADGHSMAAATRDSGIFVSTNDGLNWQQWKAGIDGIPVRGIAVHDPDHFFVATESNGVYADSNGGLGWVSLSVNLNDLNIRGLAFDNYDHLFAITDSGGLFVINALAVKETYSGIPSSFALEQNYPNPFNPTTTIAYTVGGIRSQESGFSLVRLAVYDLLGRELAVLVNERKGPGSYEVTFNASGFASGVYIYRLTAGSVVETRRMILLR